MNNQTRREFLSKLSLIAVAPTIIIPKGIDLDTRLYDRVRGLETNGIPHSIFEDEGIETLVKAKNDQTIIKGTLTDMFSGSALDNLTVRLFDENFGTYSHVITNSDGFYSNNITSVDNNTQIQVRQKSKLKPASISNSSDGIYINYEVEKTSHVRIGIYTISGALIKTIEDAEKTPGSYTVEWDGKNRRGIPVAYDTRIARLITDGNIQAQRISRLGNTITDSKKTVPESQNITTVTRIAPSVGVVNQNKKYHIIVDDLTGQHRTYKRESFFYADGSATHDELIVPSSFDMDLYTQVARTQNGIGPGTTRWTTNPKFYIVNDAIPGYTGFEKPTDQMINELTYIINNDLKTFTNGFVSDPEIVIGNDPLGAGAASTIGTGEHEGKVLANDGWITINYTLSSNMTFAGERITHVNNDYSMQKARVRIRGSENSIPVEPLTNRKIGMHELTGVMGSINNIDEQDAVSVMNSPAIQADNYRDFDLKFGKLLYLRPAGNKSPDKDY